MKNLIIIGAGGYGREVSEFAKEACGYGEEFVVKGFIDDTEEPLGRFSGYPPVVGRIVDYVPQSDDVFVCAIGDIMGRKKCTEMIESRGGQFISLVSIYSTLRQGSCIGRGCIIQNVCNISCDCVVGDHVHMQGGDVIGHDTRIGNWCFLHTGVHLGGGALIGEGVHLYPYAIVHPHKRVGDYATVGAGAFVLRNVPAHRTVYGNPGKLLS